MIRASARLALVTVLLASPAGCERSTPSFDPSSPFRLDGHGPVGRVPFDRVPLALYWELSFNAPFDATALGEHLVIEPPPLPGSLVVEGWGPVKARIRAQLAPGVAYRLSVAAGFSDAAGHRLAEPVTVQFVATDLAPRLDLPASPILVSPADPRIPISLANVEQIEARLWRFDGPQAFARALAAAPADACGGDDHEGGAAGPLASPAAAPSAGVAVSGDPVALALAAPAELNHAVELSPALPAEGDLFCLQLSARGRGSLADGAVAAAALVQRTGLALTAKVAADQLLARVTRLSDGSAAFNTAVTLIDAAGTPLSSGRTDADGIALLAVPAGLWPPLAGAAALSLAAELELDSDADYAEYERAWLPLTREHRARLGPNAGAKAEAKVGASGASDGSSLPAVLFVDGERFAPGDEIHVGIILGPRPLAAAPAVGIAIRGPKGLDLSREEQPLAELGTAHFTYRLPAAAAPGRYEVRVTHGERVRTQPFWVERSFGDPSPIPSPAPAPAPGAAAAAGREVPPAGAASPAGPPAGAAGPAALPASAAGPAAAPAAAAGSEAYPGGAAAPPAPSDGRIRALPQRITLTADRSRYAAGDVARVTVTSSYATASGLLTSEREGLRGHRVFSAAGPASVLDIPITADSAPNLWVAAHLIPLGGAAPGSSPAPAFEVGAVELPVDPEAQRLGVAMRLQRPTVRPGEAVQIELYLSHGEDQLGGGRAFVLVHEASGGRVPGPWLDPVSQLYPNRPSGVSLFESRWAAVNLPSGRSSPGPASTSSAASTADTPPPAPPDPSPAAAERRRTLIWRPEVSVPAASHADLTLPAPASPGRYRILAVGVDADGRVGTGEVGFSVEVTAEP